MIEVVDLRVADLDPNPWNPNVQSEIVSRATRESIEHFGFVAPVAVRRSATEGRYEIVNGEHRWREATDLGHDTIPAVILDLTDAQAKKLTVVLNETTGDPDVVRLGQLLVQMEELDDFRVGLPYSDEELEHLLLIGRQNWEDHPDRQPPDPPVTRDVTFTLTPDQHDRFEAAVVALADEYAMTERSAVVFEAMRVAAHKANQG